MAARWENVQEGYDIGRFVGEVREDLLCSICQEVPNNPVLCRNKDHIFCLAHISQHLENSQTCPVCRDDLTQETLRRPTGFLKNYLDDLKIKCDHHDRGCPDVVRLEDLPRHVYQCGFAPAMCRNEGCGIVVSKRDKEYHDQNLCQFRIAKCHDCKEIKASQDEMKISQDEMQESLDEMKASQDETQGSLDEMRVSQYEMKASQDELKKNDEEIKQTQAQMDVKLTEIKTGIERYQEQTKDGIKMEVNKLEDKMTAIERKQDRMQQSFNEMKQQFAKMMKMFNEALRGTNVNNIGAQATDPRACTNNQGIIILGGRYGKRLVKVSNTVEKFNITEGESTELPPLNIPRAASASCVYNNAVIVTGGYDGQDGIDSMEISNMTQHPLRWTLFRDKLPARLSGHAALVYRDKLYVIGGDNWNERKTSDVIYELNLAASYAAKPLARMPQARRNHRAEIVNNHLFIIGGTTTYQSKDVTDSVMVFDCIKKQFETRPPLPMSVSDMSTATWGNMIIVIGGVDKNGQVLDDVIVYDAETGGSERLPSLNHKRSGCSAVIIDDVIVVLGGWNKEQGYLNSVESFTMGSDGWKELPGMRDRRNRANSVVIPPI